MAKTVNDVMTTELVTCPSSATIAEAAALMRDNNIGDVLVTGGAGELTGIVTDRDLVIRCLADGMSADATVDSACSSKLTAIRADSSVDDAAQVMRERSLRRLPVVDGDRAVGIVSLGDLAIERDPDSALGGISAAAPND